MVGDGSALLRIKTVLELLELGEAMLRQRLRRQHAFMSEQELEAAIRAWYERDRCPDLGAATGPRREIAIP